MHPANKKEPGLGSAASLFSSYRSKAKTRGISFKLTFEEFLKITAEACYLCGRPPEQRVKARGRNGDYVYNGIDRIDNAVGYVSSNSRACCKICNQMKSSLTLKELADHIKKILAKLD